MMGEVAEHAHIAIESNKKKNIQAKAMCVVRGGIEEVVCCGSLAWEKHHGTSKKSKCKQRSPPSPYVVCELAMQIFQTKKHSSVILSLHVGHEVSRLVLNSSMKV